MVNSRIFIAPSNQVCKPTLLHPACIDSFLRHTISNSVPGYIPFRKGNPPKFTSLPAACIRRGRLDHDTHLLTVCWTNLNYNPTCMTVSCTFTRVIKLTGSKYSSNDIVASNTITPYHSFDDAR